MIGFLKRSLEGFHTQAGQREDVFEVSRRINEAKDSLATVRLFLLTDHVFEKAESLSEETIPGIEIRYVLWDLNKLSQLKVGQRGIVEIDFKQDYDETIPCLQGGTDGNHKTYLAFMPGHILASIYGEHGQRLLERNVRAFLSAKGKINKGLQETLKDEPRKFLAYNNGLCCTAAKIKLEKRSDGQLGLVKVEDFQIVNGGQTTASIYHAWRKENINMTRVMVQMKLTVIEDQDDLNEVVPLIAKFANSQNKVSAADLAANGKYHQNLEAHSRQVFAPAVTGLQTRFHWYYERARGSYLDDKNAKGSKANKADWEKINPKDKKFSKTDVAKYEHAWVGLPHLVCLGADKNFVKFAERMENDGEPEVTLEYFHHLVAKAIIWRATEKLFDSLNLEGYRANTVAYAISWMAEKSQRRINLDEIWEKQRVSPKILEAIRSVCAVAWQQLNRQAGNVGEGSKKEQFWEEFRKVEIALNPDWMDDLADRSFENDRSGEKALESLWEEIRIKFANDGRTMEELEAFTGNQWVKKLRRKSIASLACLGWMEFRKFSRKEKVAIRKIRQFIEMMQIAAQDL
jgi:hypothetical protein